MSDTNEPDMDNGGTDDGDAGTADEGAVEEVVDTAAEASAGAAAKFQSQTSTSAGSSLRREPEYTLKRHPIRGAIYGLLLGLGVAIYLIIFSVIPFSITTPIVIAAIGLVVGAAWGAFAPPRKITV